MYSGATAFGISYLPAVVVAVLLRGVGDPADALFVPIASPFIVLAERGLDLPLFVADAVVQAVGLGVLIAGIVLRATWVEPPDRDVLIVPTASSDGAGLAILGAF